MNPYAQGGWKNSANPNALDWSSNVPPRPSLLGALPFFSPASPPTLLSFTFASFNPSILNSTVTGPQSRLYFRITTDSPTAPCTAFFDATGNAVAIIEWRDQPVVEIRGILSKRRTSQWLALSQNGSRRKMEALGKQFVWVPNGDLICLYAAGVNHSQLYAQVSRDNNSVILELTAEAIQLGLLESCVVAAFLLQCGKNID
ncbi:hypothetical protein MSAN_02355400 [Mycena sanguinolenta]|uniref:DUF6593 domain-containing protein n=1 Tax=Mycena sanguinolenta TaxID=230812 RepID=A0A8H6X746_9AGAR|nr:hypothetical protein MSAN_02355400 [Mycena sanguinolenta]